METRFKEYLVEQFKSIAPTKASMEYRIKIYKQLMDRAQELKIKGIEDPDMIYNMCIEELGDFQKTLNEFENKEIKTKKAKRFATSSIVISISIAFIFVLIYLIVGGVTGVWHPTWLILVGGIFAELLAGLNVYAFGSKKVNFLKIRVTMIVNEVLFTVFLFLLLQLAFNLNKAWQIFLVLPALLFGIDNIFAHVSHCKGRWYETPIAVEILFVMLYVLLGLNIPNFWHPGWLLCLVGVAFVLIEIATVIVLKNRKAGIKEKKRNDNKYLKEDPRYYTDWDD